MRTYFLEALFGLLSVLVTVVFYFCTERLDLALVVGILLGALAAYGTLVKHGVDSLLKRAVTIYELQSRVASPLLRAKCDQAVNHCIRCLRQLADGQYEVQGLSAAFSEVTQLYNSSRGGDNIRSVVLVSPSTILEGAYLEVNNSAVERGVGIEKIFVVRRADLAKRKSELMAFERAGVGTKIVAREELSFDQTLVDDFLIAGQLVAVSHFNANGQLSSLHVSERNEDIGHYAGKFAHLRAHAETLSEEEAPQ